MNSMIFKSIIATSSGTPCISALPVLHTAFEADQRYNPPSGTVTPVGVWCW
jgi:hypothetical protein